MAIVVIGSVFVDVKGFPFDRYIPAGCNAGRIEIVHGGVGRNVAEDIANIGLRPKFLSIVDDSPQGEDVLRRLRERKLDVSDVLVRPDGMGMWLAVFNESGDVVASISKRPEMLSLLPILEEKGDEIFAAADSIVIQIDIGKKIIEQVFRLARKYSKRIFAVVSNMGIALECREFFHALDCLVCNLQEAEILFKANFSRLSPAELCEELCRRLVLSDIPSMVLTTGADGCVYADKHGEKGVFKAMDVTVLDTTGAGDAFCAGVTAAMTYGKTLREAVAIGTRLAASVISVSENVCPRFLPSELGIEFKPEDRFA